MAKRNGFEPVDDKPVAVPLKFRSPPGEVDRLRSMMANLVVSLRGQDDVESFEESLDFEDPDDEDPLSHSEMRYMREEVLLTEAQQAAKVASQRRAADEYRRNKHGSEKRGVDGSGASGDARGDGGVSQERAAGAGKAGSESGGERGVRETGGGSARSGGEDAVR